MRRDKTRVHHIGIVGDFPGGMAQVVNGYLDHEFENVTVSASCSTAGRRDPWSVLRSIGSIVSVLRMRVFEARRRHVLIVIHLSERGSFVREGLILRFVRMLKLPVAAHLHGAEFADFASRYRWLVRYVLTDVATVFVLTEETESIVEDVLGLSSPPVVRVPNAVELSVLPAEKRKWVVFAGAVGYRKGIDVLTAAWDLLPKHEWTLVVAGPVEANFERSRLDARQIEYLGSISHDDTLDLLRCAEVAVLPSRGEALPMFVLEALGAGCALVTTDVGQMGALFRDGGAFVTTPGDVADLANGLQLAMFSEDSRRQVQRDGRNLVESQFSQSTVFPYLEGEWLRLAERR